MRERGQASVETIALIAVALAVTAALLLGIVRVAPPLTATLVQALSGAFAPAAPGAPGLDPFEGALLAAATSPDEDGPTLRDVRTHLRARLGRVAGDAAFAAAVRPLVVALLPSSMADSTPETFQLVDDETEAAWLRAKLHPGRLKRLAGFAVGLAGVPGGVYSVLGDTGVLDPGDPDGVIAGSAAGDLLVGLAGGGELVLRRRAGRGLTMYVLPV